MILHVITAISRPKNVSKVRHSILRAADRAPEVDWHFHGGYDLEREHVGGQFLKNVMLGQISDGWVCILDDDTTMHPSFLRKVSRAHRQHPDANAIVVSQRRTNGVVLQAKPENMKVGMVDAGQAVLKRSLIGNTMIPETYAGDGEWLEALLFGQPDVHYMSEVLSLHNALSGIDVSETPERMGA